MGSGTILAFVAALLKMLLYNRNLFHYTKNTLIHLPQRKKWDTVKSCPDYGTGCSCYHYAR